MPSFVEQGAILVSGNTHVRTINALVVSFLVYFPIEKLLFVPVCVGAHCCGAHHLVLPASALGRHTARVVIYSKEKAMIHVEAVQGDVAGWLEHLCHVEVPWGVQQQWKGTAQPDSTQ